MIAVRRKRNQSNCTAIVAVISILLLAPAWSQDSASFNGIAHVSAENPGEKRKSPGTGFVVALKSHVAYLVTCSHVVEGDPQPKVQFLGSTGTPHTARVEAAESGDRGLALLVVRNPPAGLVPLLPSPRKEVPLGQKVKVAGFPADLDSRSFTILDTTVAARQGKDLFVAVETREGFSGGPVLTESNSVVGLVYGRRKGFGAFVLASEVQSYLEGFGLRWNAPDPISPPPVPEIKGPCASERQQAEATPREGPLSRLVECVDQMGEWRELVSRSDDLIHLNPGNAAYWRYRGKGKRELTLYDGAIADLEKAIELEPNWPQSYFELGITLLLSGDYQYAVKNLQKAVSYQPNNCTYRLRAAEAYDKVGSGRLAAEMRRPCSR